jgi:hypothetical protein
MQEKNKLEGLKRTIDALPEEKVLKEVKVVQKCFARQVRKLQEKHGVGKMRVRETRGKDVKENEDEYDSGCAMSR